MDLGKNRGINQAGQKDNKKRLIRLSKKLTERQKAKREKTASKETDTPSSDGAKRLKLGGESIKSRGKIKI